MSHGIQLVIANNTKCSFNRPEEWFNSGGIASGSSIPNTINPGDKHVIDMEGSGFLKGCSGYISYWIAIPESNDILDRFSIAFSNPASGTNKLGVGIDGNKVWNDMSNHDYKPFDIRISYPGYSLLAKMLCTGGSTNRATVELYP